MRSRPRVKLTLAPGVIYPGTTFRADLHVECDDETPCDFVDIRLVGYEQMFLVSGNARREGRHTFTDLPLGIDLGVGRRGWADIFGGSGKLAVRAREDAQAAGLLGPELMELLAALHDVHLDDCGGRLGQRGNAQVADRLHRIVAHYEKIALLFADAIPRLPPPAAMTAHVAAWEAYAARLRGRLQRGGMWIRGTSGTDVVEVGTLWGPKGEIAGTRVAVVLDPPMDADLDAPTTSAAARAELQELAAAATTHHTPNALAVLLPVPLADPAAAEPWLERLCRAARALRGQTSAGPFR